MKNIIKMLFSIFVIGLVFTGIQVEAKEVSWNDLVAKLKEGRVVEEITNAKNNGEDQDISITATSNKFIAVISIEGESSTFELNYSDGKVTYGNDFIVDSDQKAVFARLHDKFIDDVVLSVGELYSYGSNEVVALLSSTTLEQLTLANDGIEITRVDYSYQVGNINFEGDRINNFKLDLVNGFADLEEIVECPEEDEPTTPEPSPNPSPSPSPSPSASPEVTPETPKSEEEKLPENPSTGDVQLYYVVGGIVVCMVIAISAAIHLRKKEEII